MSAAADSHQRAEQLRYDDAQGMKVQLDNAYEAISKRLQPLTDLMYDKERNSMFEKILAAAEEKTEIRREKLLQLAHSVPPEMVILRIKMDEDRFWQKRRRCVRDNCVGTSNHPAFSCHVQCFIYFLVYGTALGICIYIILGALAQIISNIVGFVYPAWRSIKAVRSSTKEDDTQWLVYWIVFASFSIIDFSTFSSMPFYWVLKIIFLMYLYLPMFNGATVIYKNFIDPACTIIESYFHPAEPKKSD